MTNKKEKPNEVAAEIELNQTNDQTIIKFPKKPELKTKSGRNVIALKRLTY